MNLERVPMILVTCLALMSSISPASAAPRGVEDFCFDQLQQVMIPHRRAAGEAFMANCIANLTMAPKQKRRYRKY